jgi:hypothetical protein
VKLSGKQLLIQDFDSSRLPIEKWQHNLLEDFIGFEIEGRFLWAKSLIQFLVEYQGP